MFQRSGRTRCKLMKHPRENVRNDLRVRGFLGFDQARYEALERVNDPALSSRIAAALAGRFREVIVDEAQDCNPDDLKIISWLRDRNMPVKVVCDPHQSIYEFRGGVTDHLFSFAKTFAPHEAQRVDPVTFALAPTFARRSPNYDR